MPNRDGTGPEGKGPNTGRGRGSCREGNPCCGRGRGNRPRGRGRRLGQKSE